MSPISAKDLSGVFAPVVTTFSPASGDVDIAPFIANMKAHLAVGMHGIVVTGSTGEAALLDHAERLVLVDAARATVPDDKLLIVGTGQESTRACIRLTREVADRGADAVLVVAPHYYSAAMTRAALEQHYGAIVDTSPVPVILYNIPKYMHFALPAELVADLATHPNVIGIKDSSGNKEVFASYLASQSETFSVLTGNAPMFHHSLDAGGRGGILAAALFAGGLSVDIFEAAAQGDHHTASLLQSRMTPIGAKIVGDFGVAGVKAAMDRVGLAGGVLRSPLRALDDAQLAVVAELLKSAELAAAA